MSAHRLRCLLAAGFTLCALTIAVSAQSQSRAASATSDTTCTPCRDFYRFVNQAWIDTASIPPTASIRGLGGDLLDRTLNVVKQILTEAAADTSRQAPHRIQQIGAFYASCLDSVRAESDGIEPIRAALSDIDAVQTSPQVGVAAARLHRTGVPALFAVNVAVDQKNSRRMVLVISQGGIGLPDRDYYLKGGAGEVRFRAAYVEYIARAFELSGTPRQTAENMASRVLAIETALASASMTALERRDAYATYNKMSMAQLKELAPLLPWDQMLAEWHARIPDSVIVRQPAFVRAIGAALDTVPASDWRTYLRWQLLRGMAPHLSLAFSNEAFRYSQLLTGASQQMPRWQRCVNMANSTIGQLVGRAYVERAFPATSKRRMLALVANMQAVLRQRIRGLDWMSEDTKREALAKLASFRVQVGYPDRWQDYSTLKIDRGTFVRNVQLARAFEFDGSIARIGLAPDPNEWTRGVPQVFDGLAGPLNTITFTAAAFQPPFFDPNADDATNYGAIGMVIGHEMTHHFDDGGRRYDAKGNLRDWWAPADAANYNARAQRVVEQFDSYTVLDSLHVNGKFTLGENIADLGGLKIAYLAMQRAQAGKPRQVIDGKTAEQRFFIGYARMWASKARPEYIRLRLATNSHSPDEYRVNGPISNMPEFAKAFGCTAGDPMVRPASVRAEIW
jgi:putative endopeptidase